MVWLSTGASSLFQVVKAIGRFVGPLSTAPRSGIGGGEGRVRVAASESVCMVALHCEPTALAAGHTLDVSSKKARR